MAPVTRPAGRAGPAFAALGLSRMLNGGGAVLSVKVASVVGTAEGWTARVRLRGGGEFAAYANARPTAVRLAVDGADPQGTDYEWADSGLLLLHVPNAAGESTLEVDLGQP